MTQRAPKLLVGIGNLLRGDDGVGVRAAQLAAALPLPAEVEVLEVGSAGLDAADVLEARERVVVVDAIDAGAAAGTIFRLEPGELCPACRSGISVHDFHLLDALEQTRLLGRAPNAVVVLAVQVGDVSAGIGLSPAVSGALGRVIEAALDELGVTQACAGLPGVGPPADWLAGVATENVPWN
jgi:hydrogenase maturation protease